MMVTWARDARGACFVAHTTAEQSSPGNIFFYLPCLSILPLPQDGDIALNQQSSFLWTRGIYLTLAHRGQS